MSQFAAGVFLRIACDPIVRVWAGAGPFALPADLVETTGGTYSGLGEMVDLPTVQQLINGVAERVTFTLSGITADIVRLAEEDAETVRGAQVNLGFLRLDAAQQPVGSVYWLWEGEAGPVQCHRVGASDGSVIRTIGLSVGTAQTGRKRTRLTTFTPVHQRQRSRDDAGCDFVPLYSAGSTKKWG